MLFNDHANPFSFQGNYDQYVKTREELEENQMKRFNWEQDQIAHMKVNQGHHVMGCFHCTEWEIQKPPFLEKKKYCPKETHLSFDVDRNK